MVEERRVNCVGKEVGRDGKKKKKKSREGV